MKKEVIESAATLTGTVIGAGILGIPYVVARAGFLTGLMDIVFLGFTVILLYLFYGEVILRTKETHQLTGYAEKYLGKTGKILGTIAMAVGIYAALIAYIIGVGASTSALIGGNRLVYSTLFLIFGASMVYVGISAVEKSELFIGIGVLVSILLICALSIQEVEYANISEFSIFKILQPYGVIFFSFLGTAALPEMREELKGKEKYLKKGIILGMIIPIFIYSVFSMVVIGVVGLDGFNELDPNNRIATIALGNHVGEHLWILGNIFGIFAMTTSFLSLALALKEMFVYDFKYNKNISLLLTIIPPFGVALLNFTDFISVINFSGVFVAGLTGILIVLMHWSSQKKGNRKPEYSLEVGKWAGVIIIALFVLAVVHNLFF